MMETSIGVNPKLQGRVGCREVRDLADTFLVAGDSTVLLVITVATTREPLMCVQCLERSSEHNQQGPSG